jgi:uncharacterized DUF497 family protein
LRGHSKRAGVETFAFMLLHKAVEISFDPVKRQRNLAKHGLDLADAAEVIEGVRLETLDDRYDYGEERWFAIGMLRGRVVACIWTEEEPGWRASYRWKATRHEQEEYVRHTRA